MLRMPGTISQPGTDNTLENTRTIGTFITNSSTLAMNNEAIRPHTSSGLVSNSTGPGVMLYSVSAPIITAVVPEPGTPSVSIGTNEPMADAVAAATLAPAPGSPPTPKPTSELRTMLHQVNANSFRLNSLRPLGLTSTLCPATTFSSISSISATANSAMTTTTKSMPSARCTESKV